MTSEGSREEFALRELTGPSARPLSLAQSEKTLTVGQTETTKLKRSYFALVLFLCYAILALFSWTAICVLSVRPFGASLYGHNGFDSSFTYDTALQNIYVKSQRIYKVAGVINSILAVITIPLASTICARAAVIYSQHRRHPFTIRQTAALADRDWVNPIAWFKLLDGKGNRSYGSILLWFAILLHIIGMFNLAVGEFHINLGRCHCFPNSKDFLIRYNCQNTNFAAGKGISNRLLRPLWSTAIR
jgi:hypothetical protein